jgi:hypothetical protein
VLTFPYSRGKNAASLVSRTSGPETIVRIFEDLNIKLKSQMSALELYSIYIYIASSMQKN